MQIILARGNTLTVYRSKLLLFYLLQFILVNVALFAQTRSSSYEGTHFFVGFMQNEIAIDPRYGGLHLKLFISAVTTCDITIIYPPDSSVNYNSVSPKTVLEIEVPNKFESYNSEIAERKAIEIISTAPIVVYAFSTQYLTSDGYSAIPVEQWGKEYVVVSYPNDQYLDWEGLSFQDSLYKATPRQSEFMIIAAYDSTQITFFPRAITEKGVQINSPRSLTLHRGQCYLVKSFPLTKGYGDLTGTLIQGNKPFGLLSGHVRTAVPQTLVPKWDSKNHLVEMLMPVISWGREFITVPFATGPRGDLIRIVGYFDGTTITSLWDGGSSTYILNGPRDFIDIPYVAQPRRWISDKPVQVAQIMMRSGTEDDYSNYDPAMVIIPPVEQYVNNINFQTPGNIAWNPNQFVGHYINIIGSIEALDSTTLNNILIKNIPSNIYIFPLFGGTHFWANIKLSYGKYNVATPKGKFTGIIYGAGLADAYAIVLGSSLTNPYIYDSLPPIISYSEHCGNITAIINDSNDANRSGIGYVFVIKDSTYNYSYKISTITDQTVEVTLNAQVIDITKRGQISFEARDRNGNFRRFSYVYEPPLIKYPIEVFFDNLKPFDSISKTINIFNTGRDISILDIRLKRKDPRLSLFIKDRLPINLKSNDSTEIVVSISPNGSLLDLYDSLIITTDCNFFITIPILITPFIANLEVIGYDFGKIPVGDSASGFVQIINLSKYPIVIDSIFIFSYPNVFIKGKNAKIFLQPNDTAKYSIQFQPKARQQYVSNVVFFDELRLQPAAQIIGEGVSPEINSLFVDFGKLRVGRFKDTVVYLINYGNADAKVTFLRFNQWHPSFDSLNFIFNGKIPSEDSIPINLHFAPVDTGVGLVSASYLVEWPKYPSIYISATGVGTLPSIQTYNVFMDTIFVDSTVTSIKPIILSNGNEILKILDIKPLFGDFDSFAFDFKSLQGISLPVDSLLMIPITFIPKFVGEHKLALEIVSDASTGWNNRIDTVYIFGFAIPRDTVKAMILLEKDLGLEKLCNESLARLTIKNFGRIPFSVTSIKFEIKNLAFTNIDTSISSFPFTILPQESFAKILYFNFSNKGKSSLIAIVTINDTLTLADTLEFDVGGLEQNLQINFTPDKVEVYNDYQLSLAGKFLEPSFEPFDYQIILELNVSQLYFDWTKPVTVTFSNSNAVWSKEVSFLKSDNKFLGNFGTLNLQGEPTDWELSLQVRTLFNTVSNSEIQLFGIPSYCFDTSSVKINYGVLPVCAQDLRGILIDGIDFRSIFPNPTSNSFTLEYFSTKNSFVNLKIFDKLGNCILENSKELKKGLNYENFDVSFLSNGCYLLKLHSKELNKQFMLIIIK